MEPVISTEFCRNVPAKHLALPLTNFWLALGRPEVFPLALSVATAAYRGADPTLCPGPVPPWHSSIAVDGTGHSCLHFPLWKSPSCCSAVSPGPASCSPGLFSAPLLRCCSEGAASAGSSPAVPLYLEGRPKSASPAAAAWQNPTPCKQSRRGIISVHFFAEILFTGSSTQQGLTIFNPTCSCANLVLKNRLVAKCIPDTVLAIHWRGDNKA